MRAASLTGTGSPYVTAGLTGSTPWGATGGSQPTAYAAGQASPAAGVWTASLLERSQVSRSGSPWGGGAPGASGAGSGSRWGSPASSLPGPSLTSSLTRQERSLVGVARWPDGHNRESEPDQRLYGRSFWRATREAGSRISEGRVGSYRQLWNEARDWRSRSAGSRAKGFDTERGPGHQGTLTPLEGTYEYIRDRYSARTDGTPQESLIPDAPPSRRFQLTDEIDGRPVSLTSIVLSGDLAADRDSPYYTALREAGLSEQGEPFHIDHTAPAEIPRILDHAESLYRKALDTSTSDSQALKTMGELHWWVANAMPDDRGSAAKTEFTVRSIAQSRGMDLPPFQRGTVPDLEAMTMPRSKFVEKYPDMFDWNSGSAPGSSAGTLGGSGAVPE